MNGLKKFITITKIINIGKECKIKLYVIFCVFYLSAVGYGDISSNSLGALCLLGFNNFW